MKNLKRLVSSLLCGTLLAALLTTPAFALTFPDVEERPHCFLGKGRNKRNDR